MIEKQILQSSAITKIQKHFLLTLDTFSDRSGRSWPSQETLAQRMSVSIRYVKKILRQLVELGLIKVKRRWRRSNVYYILCRVGRGLSTMGNCGAQQNRSNDYKNGSSRNGLKKIPKEDLKICFEDSEAILGKRVAVKNRGWLITLIRTMGSDAYLEALRWLHSTITMGEAEGKSVASPGGLLTWYVRKMGYPV